ncbi:MAG: hypothetical protein Q7S32_04655 [bacterium]|nr:hypothetical protein [bacterium]
MSNDVSMSEMRGPLGELCDQCSGTNGRARFEEFKLWLKKAVALLTHLSDTSLGSVKKFVAAENFTKRNTKVKFWDFGSNFEAHFLGKTERNVSAAVIAVHRLERASLDPEIMTELGEKRISTLAHFYQLIEAQGQGQAGTLLVNGYANIAYIEDDNGVLWAVNADWSSGRGWGVGAGSIGSPSGWGAGFRVVSR